MISFFVSNKRFFFTLSSLAKILNLCYIVLVIRQCVFQKKKHLLLAKQMTHYKCSLSYILTNEQFTRILELKISYCSI